jgi:sugar phosphate isomerase/epimerase
MRFGGPIFQKTHAPDEWSAAVRAKGYRAAYCPVPPDTDDAAVRAYEDAARKADLVIAECGAWSNPLSKDEKIRSEALANCRRQLDLAERIGARCCVNIAGSRGAKWDGPSAEDLTGETFALIVESVRSIIDAVKPKRTFYTLETMPWMYPDSVESYERLIKAIDRAQFAVHFDAVNLVNCPARYFDTAGLIREFVRRLGAKIKSCHLKDIGLSENLTVHLSEVPPGTGGLDYRCLLSELNRLEPDLPVMLEHLPGEAEYDAAAKHIRDVAAKAGASI